MSVKAAEALLEVGLFTEQSRGAGERAHVKLLMSALFSRHTLVTGKGKEFA